MATSPPAIAISVVIPAHNAAHFIKETLDSVLAQTYPAVEVNVVDDDSTDETAEIVQAYGKQIKLLRQQKQGAAAARNLGIRQAQGEYIAFLDADDLWLPEKLERQVDCIINKKVAWVTCKATFFDHRSGRTLPAYSVGLFEGDVLEKLFLENFILSPTPIVKKSIFSEVGYFNEAPEARIGEDWDMWLRIAARHPLGVVRQNLALKREHPGSMMQSVSAAEKLHIQLAAIERAVSREADRLGPLKNKLLAKKYLDCGIVYLTQEQLSQARNFIAHARRLEPFSLRIMLYWLIPAFGEPGLWIYRLYRNTYKREV